MSLLLSGTIRRSGVESRCAAREQPDGARCMTLVREMSGGAMAAAGRVRRGHGNIVTRGTDSTDPAATAPIEVLRITSTIVTCLMQDHRALPLCAAGRGRANSCAPPRIFVVVAYVGCRPTRPFQGAVHIAEVTGVGEPRNVTPAGTSTSGPTSVF